MKSAKEILPETYERWERMTVRELIARDISVVVYDDVSDELDIGFVGPAELTDEGLQHFAPVLDFTIELEPEIGMVIILLFDAHDSDKWGWERHTQAKEFFEAAYGRFLKGKYDKWFRGVAMQRAGLILFTDDELQDIVDILFAQYQSECHRKPGEERHMTDAQANRLRAICCKAYAELRNRRHA